MVIEDEKDPYWSIATRGLMYGLICQLIKEVDDIKAVTFENVVALKNRIFKSDESRERFTQSFKMDDPIFVSMSASLVNADNTRRCILSYFDSTILDFVSLPSISDMLSENEFDMDTIGFEKTAIFLIVPDEVESMNCLASAFISEAYHTLIMKAQEKEEHRLPIRVNFILDEFCNIPRIDAMSNIITASRSRNIRFMLAIQSHNQLIATYGDKADTIMSNCLSIVYLYTRDYGFLSYLSNIVGEDENGRSLITPSALMRLNKNKGEALILCERMDPFISNLLDINELLTGNEIQPYVPEPKSPVIRYSITGRKKGNANRRIKKEPKPNWDEDPFAF